MPKYLKMLTAMGFAVLAGVAATMLPSGVAVYGRHVTTSDWWGSGAGLFLLCVGLIMSSSAVLMLKRSRYGRPTHIFGWAAISISGLLANYVAKGDFVVAIPAFGVSMVLTALIALYLYGNKNVRDYFHAATEQIR